MKNCQRILSFKAVFAVLALSVAGCWGGPSNLAQVTGMVTLDGKPYEGVSLTFRPEIGRPGSGVTDAEGRYKVYYTSTATGAPIGPQRVTVTKMYYPNPDSVGIEMIPEGFREFSFEVLPNVTNEFNIAIVNPK